MNVFNSLGSNYNLKFVLKTIFTRNNSDYNFRLKESLERKYGGRAILVYKGREALELALELLNLPKNTLIAINGFTCFSVYKAIENAGYKVEYIDIESDLNFSVEEFKTKLKEELGIKVLIIQNTLGYPCQIEEIAKICRQNKILLIEDLAHSVGTIYKNNQEAGTIGDFVTFSFSQDKIIDGVSGGALIIRNKKYQNLGFFKFDRVNTKTQIRDKLYPLFTYKIRNTYQIGIGKILHAFFKKANLLSQPMGDQTNKKIYNLPGWYCHLAQVQFNNLPENLKHRRIIASIYTQGLSQKIQSKKIIQKINYSTNLRFPIFIKNRERLIKYLKKYGIYVSDIWYDAPIAPKKYISMTNYINQCPKAEKISSQILNLPTHINISEKEANYICERINKWLKLQ